MSKRIKNKEHDMFDTSAIENTIVYNHYFNRLMELAISMFEWKNLPDTMDARFLEYTLCLDGMAVLFQDEVLGGLDLQVMVSGPLDVYRVPIERRAFATNGYQKVLDNKNSVIVYNNMLRTNCMDSITMFAHKLYECDRTIDVNVKAQKTPVMVLCDENQRLTMKNLYMKYEGNQPFIFGSKDLDLKSIQALSTNAPWIANDLYEMKTQIWNEALTYLGISNTSYQKKERLLQDEVSRNMGSTIASRYTRLEMRKKACREYNKMFGANIDVEYRSDLAIYGDGELMNNIGDEPEREDVDNE